ncbi:MAG: bacterial transcriptional activator domain-containing protein [Paracoccaceae bacterium]
MAMTRTRRPRPHPGPRSRPRAGLAALLGAALAAAPATALAQGGAQGSARGLTPDLEAVEWSSVRSEVPGFPGVGVFEMPRVFAQTRVVAGLAARGETRGALRAVERLIARHPLIGDFHATRALLLARLDRSGAALRAFDVALDLGYDHLGRVRRTPAFSALTSDPGFRDLAGRERTPPRIPTPRRAFPARVEGQTALVEAGNTRWRADLQSLEALFRIGSPDEPFSDFGRGRLARRINAGEAAGLAGLLYDNRDGGHSTLEREDYPGLAFVEYSDAAREAGIHYGAARQIVFDQPTFGNSSTAHTAGTFWRSQPRAMLTEAGGAERLATLYRLNHLYVYPEHRDHDPATDGGEGDLFPANTPFFVVSQGSSGSDEPFLEAIAHILAAMRPETRAYLEARGLIAPTVQMVLRRGMAGIDDERDAYLSADAHPVVFDAGRIDLARMRSIAERLTPASAPPAAVVGVLKDLDASEAVELFSGGLDERLFDTPFAIARLWRSTAGSRSMMLVAGTYAAEPGLEPRFVWRVLQGDPERVRLTPLGENGRRARLEVDWHDEIASGAHPDMASRRVDVAVFVDNGEELSAPAFVSIAMPRDQARRYEADGEGGRRLAEIDFAPEAGAEAYVDPVLFPRRPWRDVHEWLADGSHAGWTRRYADGRADERYTPRGLLIAAAGAAGRPTLLAGVEYRRRRRPDGREQVSPEPSGRRYRVIYPSDDAPEGTLVPLRPEGEEEGEEGDGAQGQGGTGAPSDG